MDCSSLLRRQPRGDFRLGPALARNRLKCDNREQSFRSGAPQEHAVNGWCRGLAAPRASFYVWKTGKTAVDASEVSVAAADTASTNDRSWRVMREALFYSFCLERHVPDNHMLRKIDRFVDLSALRAHLGPYYSEVGRPGGKELRKYHRCERKKVEMLIGHLKRILRLDRLRPRGPSGAKDEFLLAATAQNLRKLAKLIPLPSESSPHEARRRGLLR
jgi:hypothetical protein